MIGLELVVVLGLAVLLGNAAGDRYRIAPPVVLLVLGALLGFVPALREVELPRRPSCSSSFRYCCTGRA